MSIEETGKQSAGGAPLPLVSHRFVVRPGSFFLPLVAALLCLAGKPIAAAQTLGPVDGNDLAATDLERVSVGTEAPLFTLESYDGDPVELASFRGQKNVVLVFYRGFW